VYRVSQLEGQNKMSLHNLATVFGPTMLHAGQVNKLRNKYVKLIYFKRFGKST
jgi:hypothetical protein